MLPRKIGPNGHWRSLHDRETLDDVEVEPILYRVEALAVIGALADILVDVRAIRRLLEEDNGEEEEE
jgi:hypothetical protein